MADAGAAVGGGYRGQPDVAVPGWADVALDLVVGQLLYGAGHAAHHRGAAVSPVDSPATSWQAVRGALLFASTVSRLVWRGWSALVPAAVCLVVASPDRGRGLGLR